ncbi:MAG: hypothetical protein M3O36_06670 [Myxococcota bacterium]|nr:hypothetical protein [Myxococcota bacterium]
MTARFGMPATYTRRVLMSMDEVAHERAYGEHFDTKNICRGNGARVRLQNRLPWQRLSAQGCGLNSAP